MRVVAVLRSPALCVTELGPGVEPRGGASVLHGTNKGSHATLRGRRKRLSPCWKAETRAAEVMVTAGHATATRALV